jgi:hypothetical protein
MDSNPTEDSKGRICLALYERVAEWTEVGSVGQRFW